jgi:hypothetical protein
MTQWKFMVMPAERKLVTYNSIKILECHQHLECHQYLSTNELVPVGAQSTDKVRKLTSVQSLEKFTS